MKRTYKKYRKPRKISIKNKKMKGGVFKTRDEVSILDSIIGMIKSKGATLTAISYSSLSGFIFKLDVEHRKENIYFSDFEKRPVYSIIFKIALISETPIYKIYKNIHKQRYQKKSETKSDYENEYAIQKEIYIHTLDLNRINICPSVIDLLFLKNNDILHFLQNLEKIGGEKGDESIKMLSFLYRNVTNEKGYVIPDLELGIILMEFVDEKEYDILSEIRIPETRKYNCLYALAEIAVLFMNLKIINYDSHSGNIFGSKNKNKQPLMIDFGRTVNFEKDSYHELKPLYDLYNKLYDTQNLNIKPFSTMNVENNDIDTETIPTIIMNDDDDVIMTEEQPTIVSSYFQRNFDEIKDVKSSDFHNIDEANKDNMKTNLEKIIRFISYIDYAKTCSIGDKIRKYPQIIPLLDNLYNMKRPWYDYEIPNNLSDDQKREYIANYSITNFDKNRFNILNFDWKMKDQDFQTICSRIKEITQPLRSPLFKKTSKEIRGNPKALEFYPEKPPRSPFSPVKMSSLDTPESEKKKKTLKRSHTTGDLSGLTDRRISKRNRIENML
jgi:hypothetical protein